jgi:hypothetical protein
MDEKNRQYLVQFIKLNDPYHTNTESYSLLELVIIKTEIELRQKQIQETEKVQAVNKHYISK